MLKKKKIFFFRGSENNVLERVCLAAKKFKSKNILFLTSDCPIFDIDIANQIIEMYQNNICDYVGNTHIRSFPDGMDVQIFNYKSILFALKKSKTKLEKEHVTLFLRNNQHLFKCINLIAPEKYFWPTLGLTIDEYKDFILLKKIIENFSKKKKYYFNCLDVISLMKKKKWYKINKKVKRKGDA